MENVVDYINFHKMSTKEYTNIYIYTLTQIRSNSIIFGSINQNTLHAANGYFVFFIIQKNIFVLK